MSNPYNFDGSSPNPNSKAVLGSVMPSGSINTAWNRCAPLITPQELRNLFFLGLPLVSFAIDPTTGLQSVVNNDQLASIIAQQLEVAEYTLNIRILPIQYVEKHPWDYNLWQSYGYLRLRERPVSSVEKVLITSADVNTSDFTNGQILNGNGILFDLPISWIDPSGLRYGQLNVVPLTTVALSGLNQSSAGAGLNGSAAFLNLMARSRWISSFFLIKYTVGFPNGEIPTIINRYIGISSAIDVLSQLAATNATNSSTSLGIDALSQSRGTPGPNLYVQRITDLQNEKMILEKKIKDYFSRSIFVSNI